MPCEGELYYRGIRIQDLVQGFIRDGRKGYEEVAYLLLFGELPDAKSLGDFKALLAQGRTLPTNFTRDVIMKAPTHDMMNSLSRSVLTLASYDSNADDISLPNVLRQCLMLISVFPMLAVYSYHAYNHYECGGSMYIHYPSDSLSTASNFLRMLRPDMQYTPLEASVLDLALVLHMEHGGGNNSSFTTHVVTSSGTDTYSAIAAALGSLKGPKHGGANYKVVQMFEDMKIFTGGPNSVYLEDSPTIDPEGTHLWHGPRCVLDIGSACAGVQILRRSAGAREGQRRRFRAVHHGRGDGARGYRAGTPHL